LDTRVTSTQGTSFQRDFFPNPKISLLFFMNSKNLGFRGIGRNPPNRWARAIDPIQDWRWMMRLILAPKPMEGIKEKLLKS
jgi:hypothetical protein